MRPSPSSRLVVGATPSVARTDTMQAIRQHGYGGPDVFSFGSVPRPRIAADEVLVRVESAGLDRGTWHVMTGRPYLMRLMGFGFRRPKQTVPGLDVAGTVVEVGAKVTRFNVGDAVFGVAKGSFAEFAPALETKLAHKPASLSFDEAAVLAVSGGTALQAIDQAGHSRSRRACAGHRRLGRCRQLRRAAREGNGRARHGRE